MSDDPFAPEKYGGLMFSHDHPVTGLGDGFRTISWSERRGSGSTQVFGGCATCHGGTVAAAAPVGPFVLPLPPEREALDMEVHTLRYGDAAWLAECAPTLEDWCQRHGHALSVWRDADVPPWLPNPKFILVELLRRFLSGAAARFLWVDADVWVHPLAPEFPAHAPGIHVMPDRPSGAVKAWPAWMERHYGACPQEATYCNAGVWACDRETAAALLRRIERRDLIEGWMEQHQFNAWLSELAGEVAVHPLPPVWNSFPGGGAAWFHHFAGRAKEKKIFQARQKAVLPDPVKRLDSPPAVPDFGAGAVVWPWKSGAAEWDELWFSCQSVIKHWSEKEWPLVLLADEKPDWWPGEFIHASRYEDALWIGTQCAEQVLWMNDDIFLLADQGPADLARARHLEDMRPKLGQLLTARNTWRRGLGQVLMRLHHHGRTTLNFSTHTPYLYRRQMAREVLDRFGQFYKIPFETAYHNWHRSPAVRCTEKSAGPHDLAGKLWINPAFRQVTPAFRAQMVERFGEYA